jgi:hypothetical protein
MIFSQKLNEDEKFNFYISFVLEIVYESFKACGLHSDVRGSNLL